MLPQSMPAGLLLTVPLPVPAFCTMSCAVVGTGAALVKVAVTVVEAATVRAQVAVPEQPPDQPEKVDPVAGAAVRVRAVPPLKSALQAAPQLMPAGLLVTVPEPVPAA